MAAHLAGCSDDVADIDPPAAREISTPAAASDPDPSTPTVADEVDAPPAARIGNVATAELQPLGDGTVSGTVTFSQLVDAIRIDVSASGLAAGQHGVHIHEVGDCSAPDGSSAGGHFSPDDDSHGAPGDAPQMHHAGDLGNMTAAADGTASFEREDAELTLVGEYGIVGRAVIIHGGMDDLESQPGGEAGERVACGVIEWGTDNLVGE